MRFGSTSVRKWAREWRESDWRETIPLASGRECPDCLATVCGGKSWREHAAWHDEHMEWRRRVNDVIRQLAAKAGMVEKSPETGEDQEAAPVAGIVVGNGQLPEEMRGGDD